MVDVCVGTITEVTGQPCRGSSLLPPLNPTDKALITMFARKVASIHSAIPLAHRLFPVKVLL